MTGKFGLRVGWRALRRTGVGFATGGAMLAVWAALASLNSSATLTVKPAAGIPGCVANTVGPTGGSKSAVATINPDNTVTLLVVASPPDPPNPDSEAHIFDCVYDGQPTKDNSIASTNHPGVDCLQPANICIFTVTTPVLSPGTHSLCDIAKFEGFGKGSGRRTPAVCVAVIIPGPTTTTATTTRSRTTTVTTTLTSTQPGSTTTASGSTTATITKTTTVTATSINSTTITTGSTVTSNDTTTVTTTQPLTTTVTSNNTTAATTPVTTTVTQTVTSTAGSTPFSTTSSRSSSGAPSTSVPASTASTTGRSGGGVGVNALPSAGGGPPPGSFLAGLGLMLFGGVLIVLAVVLRRRLAA